MTSITDDLDRLPSGSWALSCQSELQELMYQLDVMLTNKKQQWMQETDELQVERKILGFDELFILQHIVLNQFEFWLLHSITYQLLKQSFFKVCCYFENTCFLSPFVIVI